MRASVPTSKSNRRVASERATNERNAWSGNITILSRAGAYRKLLLGAQLVRVTALLLAAVLRSRWKARVAPAAVNIEYYGTSQNKSGHREIWARGVAH